LQTELIEGYGGVPGSAVADHGIEDGEELPHASDLGDFWRLAFGSEPVMKEPDDGIPARGAPNAEIEG
jgi:hypothetical protein